MHATNNLEVYLKREMYRKVSMTFLVRSKQWDLQWDLPILIVLAHMRNELYLFSGQFDMRAISPFTFNE